MKKSFVMVVALIMTFTGIDAVAGKRADPDLFEYAWSGSAEMVVYGTVAAVQTIDDQKRRAPYMEVMIRVDSVQRGAPDAGMIRLRVEDALKDYLYESESLGVGAHGLWFLHRMTRPAGREPQANLLRYISSFEMQEDPAYIETLMHYVVQDTMEQAIRPDALTLLEPNAQKKERTVKLKLTYAQSGSLENVEFAERSGNTLFDDHVFESLVFLHRALVFPTAMDVTTVEITRENYLGRN